jgi:glutathione peroxidase
MLRLIALVVAIFLTAPSAHAEGLSGTFSSIDGGTLSIENWRGRPVLVTNTASRCAFTRQYDELQVLYDKYRSAGLIVLAVPSQDFRQELATAAEVKDFCEVNFNLDIPMTDITSVRGPDAHPFYRALKQRAGFEPSWNFNKVLIGPGGEFVAAWGPGVKPNSSAIVEEIEALLN